MEGSEGPRFVNQNSIVLDKVLPDGNGFVIMHNARMYCFQGRNNMEENIGKIRTSILDLLTLRKYRILNTIYAIFRVTDNVMLILIILTGLIRGEIDLHLFHHEHGLLLAVFSVDIFNTYVEMTTKFWFLHRVVPYIGLSLYITYAAILYETLLKDPLLGYLLAIRGFAFILEEFVDYAIDLEIHYDFCAGCATNRGWISNNRKEEIQHADLINSSFAWSQCTWILVKWHYNKTIPVQEASEHNQKLNPDPKNALYPCWHIYALWFIGLICLSPFIVYFLCVSSILCLVVVLLLVILSDSNDELLFLV